MRVIPVIDLLNGVAVHAVKGERQNYTPVQSQLCAAPDPVLLAKAFRERLGLNELYVADLNSIQSVDSFANRKVVTQIAAAEKADLILDAGISEIEDARAWLRVGVRKAVIGSETIQSLDVIRRFPQQFDRDRLTFSLDLKSGAIVSRCPQLRSMPPIQAAVMLRSAGWAEIILLDLNRVGSGAGIDWMVAEEMRRAVPDIHLLVGGGVMHRDLAQLQDLGISGVLMATALHNGAVKREDLPADDAHASRDS